MKIKRILGILLACSTAFGMAACGGGQGSTNAPASDGGNAPASDGGGAPAADNSQKEHISYDILISYSTPATTLDNPNDVVTPYVENKFNIEVGEITQAATSGIPLKEMLATRMAAGNEPDVLIAGAENIAYAVGTGKYGGGLEEYIDKMENMNKYMEQDMWPRFMIGGKKVQIPCVTVNTSKDEYTSDPWNVPFNTWAMWTREDLLEKCGYSFTPLAQIDAEYCQKGEMPPEEAFAIEPAIDTPEKLTEYLEKIKALNIKVGDRDLIPMSLIKWSQFHVGTMYNFGHWTRDDSGAINGFLGAPGTKDYHQWLNHVYNNGLLDPDFLAQQDDQLQQKVASGLVGVGMMVPDMATAMETLTESDPTAVIRYIPWPKAEGFTGCFDIYESGFWRVTVATDCEYKDRLCEMWDWLYTDEGLDILTWGPEESGVWKYAEDGKTKVFAEDEVRDACLSGVSGKKGADYYGLYDWTGIYFPFMSTIAICSPQLNNYNPMSYTRSYPAVPDISTVNKSYCCLGGYNMDGTGSYGDGSDEAAKVNNYYWSDWVESDCAKVLTCSESDFDATFEEALQKFYKEAEYEKGVEKMTAWFNENVPE